MSDRLSTQSTSKAPWNSIGYRHARGIRMENTDSTGKCMLFSAHGHTVFVHGDRPESGGVMLGGWLEGKPYIARIACGSPAASFALARAVGIRVLP